MAKQAIQYGREILMRDDNIIEEWPTEAKATERLRELETKERYFIAKALKWDSIRYHERKGCTVVKR